MFGIPAGPQERGGFLEGLSAGKVLSVDSASYLNPLYPKWDDFMRIRAELDPRQVFVYAYWRQHLGISFNA